MYLQGLTWTANSSTPILDMDGTSYPTVRFKVSGSHKWGIQYYNEGLNFYDSNDYRFFIRDGGNVGINTKPISTAVLHIYNGTDSPAACGILFESRYSYFKTTTEKTNVYNELVSLSSDFAIHFGGLYVYDGKVYVIVAVKFITWHFIHEV